MAGALSLLIKPVSAHCNMQCSYCFYRRLGDPYRSEVMHIMDDQTLETMIAGYMQSAGRCVSFGWQGGEPLLAGIDFFKMAVAYQQHYNKSGQQVSNNLQTNGTLINDEWAALFGRHNFFIGLSLDGPEEYHNHHRHALNGVNSFHKAMQGIQTLRRHRVEFSILTVVNDVTVKKPEEIYQFFLYHELHRLQFIPCVEADRNGRDRKDFSVGAKDYGDFLCTLFDVWYNNGQPVASIRLFDNILAIYMGMEPEICSLEDQCGGYVVIEYNGDVYPCDFFVEEQWLLGNLFDAPISEISTNPKMLTFNSRKIRKDGSCSSCEWNFICHFGCQHYRTHNGENYLCEAYKQFFTYTRQRFVTYAMAIREMVSRAMYDGMRHSQQHN